MAQHNTLFDYDPDAQPRDERTIKVCHVDEPYDFYGGRASYGRCLGEADPTSSGWLGNPFKLADHSREEAIEKFEEAFINELSESRAFCNAVLGLEGNRVACHCRHSKETEPACHLDVVREALLDGRVYLIAQKRHQIALTDAQLDRMARPEDLL